MKTCPTCGKKFDSSDGNIYCPHCGSIADDNVLLNEKIEKKITQPREPKIQKAPVSTKENPKPRPKQPDDDFAPKKIHTSEKNYIPAIIIGLVVIIAIGIYYYYFM